jgi:hypothetical protein
MPFSSQSHNTRRCTRSTWQWGTLRYAKLSCKIELACDLVKPIWFVQLRYALKVGHGNGSTKNETPAVSQISLFMTTDWWTISNLCIFKFCYPDIYMGVLISKLLSNSPFSSLIWLLGEEWCLQFWVSYLFGNQVNWTHEIAPGPLYPNQQFVFVQVFASCWFFILFSKMWKVSVSLGFLMTFWKSNCQILHQVSKGSQKNRRIPECF